MRKGSDRNDVLKNTGVLFQSLAFQKSVTEALRTLPISRGWNILDVGCGGGESLLQFLTFGFPPSCLYGIDIQQERIHEAKEKLPNMNFVCGDAAQMNYESGYFDMVMESTMFIQLTDDELAQKNCR
jgi:ubiquinone/menaquinone biosynthesis C-methylase UbiE